MKSTVKKSGFLKSLGYEIDKTFKIGLIFTGILAGLAQLANFFIINYMKLDMKNSLEHKPKDIEFINNIFINNLSNLSLKEGILIMAIVSLLIIFIGYIWLGEWFGSNKTAYTLLTMPVSRWSIIASKFLVTYVFFLINYALLILSKYIYIMMAKKLPITLDTNILNKGVLSNSIISQNSFIMPFLIFAALGIALIFSFCLLNRWKLIIGSIIGLINLSIATGLVLWILFEGFSNPMFLGDAFIKSIIVSFIFIIINLISCNYLLKNKVHV